jgi:hypothetical protein
LNIPLFPFGVGSFSKDGHLVHECALVNLILGSAILTAEPCIDGELVNLELLFKLYLNGLFKVDLLNVALQILSNKISGVSTELIYILLLLLLREATFLDLQVLAL